MNGKPYYSADNGFACAAAAKGNKEALREHLNVIIRDEELELEPTHSQLQTKIDGLVRDKKELEEQKVTSQDNLTKLTDILAEKEVRLSKLQVKLDSPLKPAEAPPLPHTNPLKEKIDAETKKLVEKQLAHVTLETNLEVPTEIELDLPTLDEVQVSRFSLPEWSFTISSTIALLGMVFYLFIFYVCVADNMFRKDSITNDIQNAFIIPAGLPWTAFPINFFIFSFPFIFFTLTILTYLYNRDRKWKHYFGVLSANFLVHFLIGIRISNGLENLLEVVSVLFFGFGASFLLSLGITWFVRKWRIVKPFQDATIQLERRIRAEKNDRLIELNVLTTETQHAENRINDLNREKATYDEHAEATVKRPIELEIVGLNTEIARLRPQIDALNEQLESLESKMNQSETEIEALLKQQDKRVMDARRLEARTHEFITGWCRYLTQHRTELPANVGDQIADLQQIGNEIIKAYMASIAT